MTTVSTLGLASAAMQYADRAEALHVGREFQALADDRGGPWDRFPGLREHLSFVIDSAIVGCEKPDRRIFEHALRQSGARPERTLHVGDLYHADVTGARAAGIHALLLDPYDDWTGTDCDRAPDLWTVAERFAAGSVIRSD